MDLSKKKPLQFTSAYIIYYDLFIFKTYLVRAVSTTGRNAPSYKVRPHFHGVPTLAPPSTVLTARNYMLSGYGSLYFATTGDTDSIGDGRGRTNGLYVVEGENFQWMSQDFLFTWVLY